MAVMNCHDALDWWKSVGQQSKEGGSSGCLDVT